MFCWRLTVDSSPRMTLVEALLVVSGQGLAPTQPIGASSLFSARSVVIGRVEHGGGDRRREALVIQFCEVIANSDCHAPDPCILL